MSTRRRGTTGLAKQALFTSGFYGLFRQIRSDRHVAILRYHAVVEPESCAYASAGICTSPKDFERHVAYLATRYRVLPLPDVVAALRDGRSLPRHAVAITFDDGYADNLEAARVVARHGVSATFYLTAGCLKGGQPFWPAEIRGLLRAIERPTVTLEPEDRPPVEINLGGPGGRNGAARVVSRLFKSVGIPERERLRDQLRAAAGWPRYDDPMLTWDDVGEMARLGMTIGGHTMTHPNLPSAGLGDATREVAGCRTLLQDRLGVSVTMFSYPDGGAERYYTADLERVVSDVGFEAATTSRNAFATRGSDLFALERVQVTDELSDLLFALEVERFAFKPATRGEES